MLAIKIIISQCVLPKKKNKNNAEILPIRRKTPNYQSTNPFKNEFFLLNFIEA